jgi:serine phosphatase RsbU (regulator of sigma subunit)/anti-sigma regulatory factor (Ser/Thr protein kinase)
MPQIANSASRGVIFRLSLACDLAEVRPATLAVREFLSEQGLHEEEVRACETALVEACNNAVQYVTESGRREPVEILAACNGSKVELEVRDHTSGFNWPQRIELPAKDSESGRGLFLIRSLMDDASYLRGRSENTLMMRKTRCYERHRPSQRSPADLEDARHRLAEAERAINSMAKELCFRSESLAAIFRCCAELGRTQNFEEFSLRLLNDLIHITSADWFVLRLIPKNEQRLVVSAVSDPALDLPPLPLPVVGQVIKSVELQATVARSDVWFDRCKPLAPEDPLRGFKSDSIGVVWPLRQGETLVGTLAVGRNATQPMFTPAQTEALRTFGDFLAIQVVNARHQEEQVATRLVSRELEIARSIQQALLPKTLPQIRGFGLAGYCQSARQVGGDFYDALQLSDHSVLLLVADVMGNGVPAAMFAAILRSLVRAIPEWTHKPAELLARMNRLLYDELSEVDMFITAQLVVVDTKRRQLTTASAGHCPILIMAFDADDITTLSPEGMPLGIMPTTVFAEQTIRLGKQSRVLLYTDGLTDTRNASGEFFGEARLRNWLRQTVLRQQTARQFKDQLVAELNAFQNGAPLRDDQSFLLLVEERNLNPVNQESASEEMPVAVSNRTETATALADQTTLEVACR